MAYPPLVRKSSQGEKLSPASLQPTTQRYQRNFTEPANIFHRNYQQAMASHAALPSAFVGGNRSIGRSGSNNIIGTSGGDNSSMPLLTSSFNPNPNTQPDYTRMHRSFSSAADLTPETFPGADLHLHSFEPLKRTMPSAFPSMASFKRPRLDNSGNYGASALVPDRSRLCLGSPIDMPSTSAAGFYQGNEAFDDYPSQLSASASDLAAPSLAPNLQHPSSSYQTMHDPARNHAYLTIPETTSQKIENSGSYTWEPKDTLEPSEGAKGYGIQLIDDKTGQYQYTTQFGISNDHYNAKEESSAPAGYASAQSTALSAISSASKAAVSSYSALASSASVAVTSATSEHSSVAPVMTAAASTGTPSNSSVVQPTGAMTVPSSLKSSSTMSKAAYPTGSNMTSTNSTGPSNVEASTGGASNMAASIGGLVIAAGVAVFAL